MRGGGAGGSSDSLYTPLAEAEQEEQQQQPFHQPLLSPTEKPSESTNAEAVQDPTPKKHRSYCSDPKAVKHLVLALIFSLSTSIQVYTGLKVSSFDFSSVSPWYPPLMCLTVLWINAGVYLCRTLLEEMTRESGLFLPEVHR